MLLIRNIGCLATPAGVSPANGDVELYKNAAVLIDDGVIAGVYRDGMLPRIRASREIDAQRALVTPALVDCHTHMVFGGWREHELAKKLRGVSYLDILKEGGGILDTVSKTRETAEQELFDKAEKLLAEQLRFGVCTTEIKSGYGLSLDAELKQLRVIDRLKKSCKNTVVATFMGAHAVPSDCSREEYIALLCDTMLPEVARLCLAEYCDIFCETGVFDTLESEKILTRARELGFGIKIHADEMDAIGGSMLAARLNAVSAEHLIAADDQGIAALAKSGVIAALLPMTSYYLDRPFARARDMIAAGVPVAVASDFNPGSCPSLNLQLAFSMACIKYKMTPAETLCATTRNAAAAVGRADTVGTIREGMRADIVIWDADSPDMLGYRFGSNLAKTVIKNGETI